MPDLSNKKILMVIAPSNFRDEELKHPKQIFEDSGATVTIASTASEATGMLGMSISVDKDLKNVSAEDYDAIIFVGGSGASVYFNDEKALSLARDAYSKGKVIGAICIAPSILANAGILEGKKATAFSSEAENLRSKGADYTGEAVTQDDNIITASGPEFARQFGEAIAKALE